MSLIATTALAGIALMSAGHGGSDYGMAISPASVSGPSSSIATFKVQDTGHTPLNIRIAAIELRPIAGHPGSWAPSDAYTDARISDGYFQLQPGQFKVIKVQMKATDAYRHDVGIAATGQQSTVKNGAAVQTATIARYVVNPSGAHAPEAKPPVVAENHAEPSGTPTWTIAAIGGLVLALVAGTMRVLNIKRRKARANAL